MTPFTQRLGIDEADGFLVFVSFIEEARETRVGHTFMTCDVIELIEKY